MMSHEMLLAASWLLTVALHGGAALTIVYAFDRFGRLTRSWREALWRCALFGGALTATLQLALAPSPFGQWRVATSQSVVAESTATSIAAPHAALSKATPAQPTPAHAAPIPAAVRVEADSTVARMVTNPQALPRSQVPGLMLFALIGLWLAGAAIALIRLLVGMHRLRRTVATASPWPETDAELRSLARRAGAGDTRFFSLGAIPSPMAISGRRVIVPLWAIDSLDWRQLRAMLAHELAHLERHDPQWKIAICVWRALFWFMPFAGIAQQRLDEIAELACDAWAARQTGDAHSVAECLAACAEYHSVAPMPHFAPAMAVHRSLLMRRVDTLLDGDAVGSGNLGLIARCLAAMILLAGMYALPAVTLIGAGSALAGQGAPPTPPQPPEPPSPPALPSAADGHAASHISEVDILGWHTTSLSVSDSLRSFKAEIHGRIAFNPDETDVASLDAGGTAMFQETSGGSTRRIELSEDKGQLTRRYFVDGSERPYDATARAWFAALVPALMRESGLDAKARVARLYDKGGAGAVLDDIEKIQGSYGRGVYLKLLTAHGKLAPQQLDRAMRIAGDLDSDYSKQQTLQDLFATQSLDAAEQVAYFHQVARVGGDYEKSELLCHSIDKLVDDASVRSAWLTAAASVSGDYEHARSLKAILALGKLNDAQLGEVIASSANIGGAYEHAEVLKAALPQAHDVNAIAPAYIRSTQKIGSAYEHSQALLALIRTGRLDRTAADAVLDSASAIGTDYETSQVLIALARAMPDDAALVKHYREVASRLSEYERGQAESALPL